MDTASHPAWILDEVATAGRENLDPVHVSLYDEKESWDAAAEVRLATSLGLSPTSVVVDLGAGTGQFTTAVAPSVARVVAVDVSEVMLDVLGSKVSARGLMNVELARAGFVTYEHRGKAPYLIYSRYALHHLPDFWKALALERMHAMLAPGGLLRLWDIVYSFEPGEAEDRLSAWRATLDEDAAPGEWTRSDIDEHIRDEHSTFSWLLEAMMKRSGFVIEQKEFSDDRIFAKYVLRRS
jgi:ubiquinone/menaquinone biosynthesis C-methylase UbiE